MRWSLSQSVSPVLVSLSFITAPMSPARSSATTTGFFPCREETAPSLSAVWRAELYSVESGLTDPE